MQDQEGEEGASAEGGGGDDEGVGCLGVPPRKTSGSGFPLQVRALITGLAGFPLQSVTQMRGPWRAECAAYRLSLLKTDLESGIVLV